MIPRRFRLKGNKGTEAPTSLLFFDTESRARVHGPGGYRTDLRLRLWSACYVRREGSEYRAPQWHDGKSWASFFDLVESYQSWSRPLWLFSHNIGHDLTQLEFWSRLEERRWDRGPCPRPGRTRAGKERKPWRGRMCLEGRPTFLILKGRNGFAKWVDTGNYWPHSLEWIGHRYGLKKGKVDFDRAPDDEVLEYCKRDTDILRLAVCNLVSWWLKEDCGTFQVTGPMLAMTNFRHTCTVRAGKDDAIDIIHEQESPAREDERDAYLGGRIEPFFLGKVRGDFWHLDVNGLYAFVMQRELYPRARIKSLPGCTLSQLKGYVEAYGVVAQVLIDTGPSWESYPAVDCEVQTHACGYFWTTLCGPELVRAVRNGHVKDVGPTHLYSLSPLFRDWAGTWLERRRLAQAAGDPGQDEFCKMILNSLAGKFGQKGEWWTDCDDGPVRRGWGRFFKLDCESGNLVQYRWIAGHTQKLVKGVEPLKAFPVISAFVCSYGREYMRELFGLLPDRSLLYTATDSIICDKRGFRALKRAKLLHPSEPGKLKVKGPFKSLEIRGPNYYRIGREWTIAGLHGKAEKGADGVWRVELWDRLPSLLNANPGGVNGYSVVELDEIVPTMKNDQDRWGWRRPYRFTPKDPFSDEPPVRGTLVIPPRG